MKLYDRKESTNWFNESKYGVFFHYLFQLESMDKFDAEKFAANVNEMGAGHVMFTLGQNLGVYCGPNPTYEKIAGYPQGSKCYEGDIPMQIAKALEKYNIKLMLYLPSHMPSRDNDASIKFGVDQTVKPMWRMTEEAVKNWCSVVRDWSIHYGKNIHGWWFDGFYDLIKLDENLAKYYKEAILAGNEDSILALNQGLDPIVQPANIYCDYTAGEFAEFTPLPEQRFVNNAQWHVLSYLGNDWMHPNARYSGEYMADYIKNANKNGGVVTIDLHINEDGSLSDEQFRVMQYVKKQIRG